MTDKRMRRSTAPSVLSDSPLTIKLSVELSDGSLSSHVTVPVNATQSEKDEAVQRWLKIMQFGLSMQGSAVNMAVTLPGQEEPKNG